ncbi:exosortase H [Brevundimonas lutea]|uniref:exosortase H n=1 Tax=Brevundimonas lutea TaxID=2293980 RepID=UPI000F01D01B|nr:exosortase H [Brevundimonas lutea]
MNGLTQFRRSRPGLSYLVAFTIIAIGLAALLMAPPVDRYFTQPFTASLVHVCTFLINLFGGGVRADGTVLAFVDGRGAVRVEAGCNAVEVCLLLIAAILAFPATVKQRMIGVAAGVAAVQAINLLRIISLLYLARLAPDVFEFFHVWVWDALIMIDALAALMIWIRSLGPVGGPTSEPQGIAA